MHANALVVVRPNETISDQLQCRRRIFRPARLSSHNQVAHS